MKWFSVKDAIRRMRNVLRNVRILRPEKPSFSSRSIFGLTRLPLPDIGSNSTSFGISFPRGVKPLGMYTEQMLGVYLCLATGGKEMDKIAFFLSMADRFLSIDEQIEFIKKLQSCVDRERLVGELKNELAEKLEETKEVVDGIDESIKSDEKEVTEEVVSPSEEASVVADPGVEKPEPVSLKSGSKKKKKGRSRFKKTGGT